MLSDALMQSLPIREFPLAKNSDRGYGRFHGQTFRAYGWKGTYTQFLQFIREVNKDPSDSGRRFRNSAVGIFPSGQWSGIRESLPGWLESGVFAQAFETFQSAESRMEASRFIMAPPIAAVTGGAWVVPLVLTGVPMSARIRPRAKLPPVNLSLTVCVSAYVKHADISRSTAKIARAAWDYTQAGGAVRLVVNYTYGFTTPAPGGVQGLVCTVEIPLTNQAAFASACSAQQFRGAAICLAQSLSGLREDSLPVVRLGIPGSIDVSGLTGDDDKAREAFAIRG